MTQRENCFCYDNKFLSRTGGGLPRLSERRGHFPLSLCKINLNLFNTGMSKVNYPEVSFFLLTTLAILYLMPTNY